MMSCRRLWSYLVVLFVAAHLFVGCTTEVDFTLGSEYIPTNQNMELKRRVYRLGDMIESGDTTTVAMATAYLHKSDSIKSSNLDYVYFGREYSADFGMRKAGFMSQVLFGTKLDEEHGWGYRPIFDSMTLSLYVTDYHGDTTKKQRFEVYEIISNDYFDASELSKDTIFYSNFDPSAYISKEPIFEFTFPNQERGSYVGNMESPRYTNVLLEHTDATMEYIRRLMFTTNLDATDGYAVDADEIYEQGNEEKFVDRIRGVYIVPKDEPLEGEGAMFATDVENTAMVLYARSRYKEDPAIIKDTVIMSYNFFVSPTTYNVKAGNVSISCVEHELPAQDREAIDEHREVLVGKVDAMAGIITEIEFTDDFLQSLADLVHSRENAYISVNQAHLNIYLEGSSYKYEELVPSVITPILDSSMSRMGIYARYGGWESDYTSNIVAIADYLYSKESSSFKIPYDGHINRSLGCYKMNISNFVQSMMMAAASNVDESGKVQFEKFREDRDLARSRRIYLGPAADALYGFKRQRVVGGDTEVEGESNSVPITLEIVYTIVN